MSNPNNWVKLSKYIIHPNNFRTKEKPDVFLIELLTGFFLE